MSNKKILIVGASGFIGSYLSIELEKSGYKVIAVDINDISEDFYNQNKIQFIKLDITQKDDFLKIPKESFEAVIHLAAVQPANVSTSTYNARDYINVNVLGTLNILDFCRENGIKKIIYASSHRNTQGFWSENRAVKENEGRAIKYDGEYAMFSISESSAQDCVHHYNAQFDLNGVIFRLPPVYGFGPHTEIFKDGKPIKTGFKIFIENAKACIPLEVWGNSQKGRDIIYIKDVISAFKKAIEKKEVRGLFNITSGTRLTLKEEAEIIAKVFWGNETTPIVIEKPEKENSIDNFLYDIKKAEVELDWVPTFNFEEMLYDFINEEKNNTYGYLVEKRKNMTV